MRVLVVTTVHVPTDARILHRQVRSLVDAGHAVVLAAPWTATGQQPPGDVHAVDLPRSTGRARLGALRAARRVLRVRASDVDLVLLHDPELLLVALSTRLRVPVVWDVHEDLVASLADKTWLPGTGRRALVAGVRALERTAERRYHLVLAETSYARRFLRRHPMVPNTPWSRPLELVATEPRAVYVGRLSVARGAHELVAVGAELARHGIGLDLVGPADAEVRALLEQATVDGSVRWHGFLPNPQALELLDGALAGVSLLHDVPNYRHSTPTKVLEYMERGLPVITTPLPLAVDLVERHRCGTAVPFLDPAAAARAVLDLHRDPVTRDVMAARGRAAALAEHSWDVDGPAFVSQLERWAQRR